MITIVDLSMASRTLQFDFVEKFLRSKDYGILGTISPDGFPHSSSILYSVSPRESKFVLYVLSMRNYKKVKNIKANPKVSFVIPFPHYILRFPPPSSIQFQGEAEIIPWETKEAQDVFQRTRVLRLTLKQGLEKPKETIFIKIIPRKKMFGYGLGMGLMEIRKDEASGDFDCIIPKSRLERIL